MKDHKQALPDTIKKINRDEKIRITNIIKKEYPEITNFSVRYDFLKQSVGFDGLTSEQEAHIYSIVFGTNLSS